MSYGMRSRLALAFQDSGGFANVASLHHIAVLQEDFGVQIEQLESEALKGHFNVPDVFEGLKRAPGTFSMEAQPIDIGLLLKGLMGGPTTATSDALYTHVFEPRTADWDTRFANQPMTILRHLDVASADQFHDEVLTSLQLQVSAGRLLMATAGFVGGQWTGLQAVSPSYRTGRPHIWHQASVSLGGSAFAKFRELTIEIDERIQADHTLNLSAWPSRAKRQGPRAITVNATFPFDDATEYAAFLNQSERELDISFAGATAVQSGYDESLRIQLPGLRWGDFKPAAGGPGEINLQATGRGVYDVSSATALKVTLVNTFNGY